MYGWALNAMSIHDFLLSSNLAGIRAASQAIKSATTDVLSFQQFL